MKFRLDRHNVKTTSWKCTITSCPARVLTDLEATTLLKLSHQHNHEKTPLHSIEIGRARRAIKRAAATRPRDPPGKMICDETHKMTSSSTRDVKNLASVFYYHSRHLKRKQNKKSKTSSTSIRSSKKKCTTSACPTLSTLLRKPIQSASPKVFTPERVPNIATTTPSLAYNANTQEHWPGQSTAYPPNMCTHCCCCRRDGGRDSKTMAGIGELYITKPAPLFETNSVVDGMFQQVKLSDYRGKYVVLFFYPLDFTFVCPTEIIAFSDRAEEFRAIGCEVMACSTDSVYSHLAWVNTPRKQGGLGPMKIPLLADTTHEISKKYGCLKVDEGVAFRGLFIIDDKGNLRQITINDLPVGRSVDETLRLVQAFQFTDKHGEVCPAGWKPGKDTMKPDPKGKMEFFEKSN